VRRRAVLCILLVASVTAPAVAAALTSGTTFTGPSRHGRYAVTVFARCSVAGCVSARLFTVQVTAGRPGALAGRCPYGTYELTDAAPIAAGHFSATAQFRLFGRILTFSASGTIDGVRSVHGSVSGPPACGAPDTYTIPVTVVG